jgi:8-oxo-dGTP diphosphatase
MTGESSVGRATIGAACVLFDVEGRVLLVRHSYGRLNWELPGGSALPGESPDDAAERELAEETGLRLRPDRLTGVYFEPDGEAGPAIHFVFRFPWDPSLRPHPASPEVSAADYWPPAALPRPISDFTERRIHDGVAQQTVVARILRRSWLE